MTNQAVLMSSHYLGQPQSRHESLQVSIPLDIPQIRRHISPHRLNNDPFIQQFNLIFQK